MSNDFKIAVRCNSNAAAELMALAVQLGAEVTSFKKIEPLQLKPKYVPTFRSDPEPQKAKTINSPKRRTCYDVYLAARENYISTPFTVLQLVKAMKQKDPTVTKGSVSAHCNRMLRANILFRGLDATYILNKTVNFKNADSFNEMIRFARENS